MRKRIELISKKEGKKGHANSCVEQLSDVPDIPYDRQENTSFNQENKYRGVAGYKSEYDKKIRKLEKTTEILDEKENNIYVNIMTIMGIFGKRFIAGMPIRAAAP